MASQVAHRGVLLTQAQLDQELKRMGPNAYIAKGRNCNGARFVFCKRRRESESSEKTHPAQDWASDSMADIKRPKVWPTYKCISCKCVLPSWTVSPETECDWCADREGSDSNSDEDVSNNRPKHDDGEYVEDSTKSKFTVGMSTYHPRCAYCGDHVDGSDNTTLSVSTRVCAEAVFCNFDCLMRMGVKTRDTLDDENEKES